MNNSLVRRILARFMKEADLHPPLGYPGGPCHVVKRIDKNVRDPRLKDDLIGEVFDGDDLTNQEASKVYRIETDRGAGIVKRFEITSHAQYRMDLRGITVPELRAAFVTFSKQMNDWKSQRHPSYNKVMESIAFGDKIEWTDNRGDVHVVFMLTRDTARIITVYRKGERDPRPPKPGECAI